MKKILIFGNSGSGKSTLAKKLCQTEALAHLDLDTLAWMPTIPPLRKPIIESEKAILDFIRMHKNWVIEGCYSDLLTIALPSSTEIIFMNLPIKTCIENAKSRPWEPHKYQSKEEQDNNLPMLIEWISQYAERSDTFSQASHEQLYQQYSGSKKMLTQNNCIFELL
ncbi:shikimate kinase [Oceanicoccus sp. KOV_DT_Chl]|uniref:AAA family ATPase n=1 Tax=Oceanicoccus sp. KOV_DT_Chl TaxID=1904639 RepID=UPI000C7D8F37|nr:shikimate kinase [Oceanicoccus sp. KOV_DT_Chl]